MTLRPDWEEPHPSRLAPGHAHRDEILRRHTESMEANLPTYRDPVSGLIVNPLL